jgi:predicted secreted protein
MSAHDGKNTLVQFSIQPEGFSGTHTWVTLGMCSTKGLEGSWDSVETQADSTAASWKTRMATRREVKISLDGVSYEDAVHNQRTLKNQFFNPGSGTGYQPKAWFKLTAESGESWTGPYMMDSVKDDHPTDDKCTWSISATSNGAVTYAPGA